MGKFFECRKLGMTLYFEEQEAMAVTMLVVDKAFQLKSNLEFAYFSKLRSVNIRGATTGKGFAGVVKRHGFKTQDASHGNSLSHRTHGSTGQRQDPGKVFKNKKMAGHMGTNTISVKNLKVLKAYQDGEVFILIVVGSVPGKKNNILRIAPSLKKF